MKSMKSTIGIIGGVVLFFMSGLSLASSYIKDKLHHPVPGGIAVVSLGEHQQSPSVHYRNKPVMVVANGNTSEYLAIVGIPLKSKSGQHQLQLKTSNRSQQVPFQVQAKKYKEQHIKLQSNKYVTPSEEHLARIKRELAAQTNAYANFRPGSPSNVILDRPVEGGRYSSPFGLRRFFNGQERNPHSGLDIAVPTGTPVKAPADGVVTIVDDYYFNGKTVFIDHGQGMVTMYCHLSSIDVKKGQTIKRGELLGKVGTTGRSTGPHLHWNVSLNDTRVDPAIFVGAFQP